MSFIVTTYALGYDGSSIIMSHNMFRPYHDIVSCFDDLALREVDSILLDDLLDEGLRYGTSLNDRRERSTSNRICFVAPRTRAGASSGGMHSQKYCQG
jgi:hypothetical protein